MNLLAKRLVWLVGFVVAFSVMTTALVHSVSYKPYGVPDHLREDYERKVAFLRNRETKVETASAAGKPIVKTGKTVHEFGKVNPHQTLSHKFIISNEGDSPLRLNVRETSCKCTVGKLGVPVVLPGETTSVTLEWNTGFKSEDYEQTALIQTNDPKKKLIEFRVRGTIRADLVIPHSVTFSKVDLGQESKATFVVYSQLWDDFIIENVTAERDALQWYSEPLKLDDELLTEKDPKSAWKVVLSRSVLTTEKYSDTVTVKVLPGDGSPAIETLVEVTGQSRKPIAFLSPEIKSNSGLDLGTLTTDKVHDFHLTVQVRGQPGRKIQVIDVVPKLLQTKLDPSGREGFYKLTLTVPQGVDTESFNREDQRGYVQIGDPKDPRFQNWFPLYGATVKLE